MRDRNFDWNFDNTEILGDGSSLDTWVRETLLKFIEGKTFLGPSLCLVSSSSRESRSRLEVCERA